MTDARGPVAGCVFLVGSALLLTALAVTQPLALASLAVVVLGPLHVVLATRYILGRSLPALGGSTGGTLALLVAAMVLVRIGAALVPTPGRYVELIGGCGVVGWALWRGLDARRRVLGLAAVVALAAVSLLELPWYWLFLTHGHNVVPLIFLWDWARRLHPGARLAFVGANLVWASAIPAAVLSGWLDPLIDVGLTGAPDLLEAGNFILTPHVAWSSREAMQTLADQLIDNIEAFARGEPVNRVA